MKKLLPYLKDYKKESILGPLFKLLEASFELFVPLVIAAIIDKGIANSDTRYIMHMCIVLVILGIIGLISSITAQYFAAKAAVGFSAKIRHELFSHIEQLSFSDLDTIGTSTMITHMTSDVNQLQTGVNLLLRLFLRSPVVVFGAMIMAFTIDSKSAVLFAATISVICIVVFGIMFWSIPQYKKVQSRLSKVLGITRENLTGVRVIRAFNKEEDEVDKFSKSNKDLTKIQLFVGHISAIMNPLTYVIVNIAIIALLNKGAISVNTGTLTQGEVVALVNYMSQILVELIKLANLIIIVTKALASANRLQSIFNITPVQDISKTDVPKTSVSKTNLPDSSTPIIEFKNAYLTYRNAGGESLENINFKIQKGQTIGIIGGTGSGKSSLVNLIPGFYPASKGQVLINGIDVSAYNQALLRSQIGIVPQKAVLFKGTIRDNLLWGNPNVTEEEIYNALEIAQIRDFVDNKDDGLDSKVEQGGKNLSGGQKQRLTIARAVLREPDILILDDSSSALDLITDAKLRNSIGKMSGTTVLIVSQRASAIQYADMIIVLDDGRIVGMGNHSNLLKTCNIYQEIYYSQFPKEA